MKNKESKTKNNAKQNKAKQKTRDSSFGTAENETEREVTIQTSVHCRIFSNKRPGTYLEFLLKGGALILGRTLNRGVRFKIAQK